MSTPHHARACAHASQESEGQLPVSTFDTLEAFVASLRQPRQVLLLVPAGRAVEGAIDDLLKFLTKGDVLVDLGNEWFEKTEDRQKRVGAV